MSIGVQFTSRPFTAAIIVGALMLAMAYTTVGKGAKVEGPYAQEEKEE